MVAKMHLFAIVLMSVIPMTMHGKDIKLHKLGQTTINGSHYETTVVESEIEKGVAVVSINNYEGSASVYIYKDADELRCTKEQIVEGAMVVPINTKGMSAGEYTLYIVVGEDTYYGTFTVGDEQIGAQP